MSDNDSSAAEDTKRKRGRPSKADVKETPAKEVKKRGRAPSEDKKEVKKTDGATPAKRGRGRPKGSTKRKGKAAGSKAVGKGPAKAPKKPTKKAPKKRAAGTSAAKKKKTMDGAALAAAIRRDFAQAGPSKKRVATPPRTVSRGRSIRRRDKKAEDSNGDYD